MIRVRFSCFGKNCLQVHNSTEDIYKAFLKEYSAVSFYGLMSERNMKPQTSGELLNISLYFRKENLYLSANEVEIILSLALINEGKVVTSLTPGNPSTRDFDKEHQFSGLLHKRNHRTSDEVEEP